MTSTEVVLDLSRLLSRVLHVTPTGVDRVEMAYARGLAVATKGELSYAALHPAGVYGRLASQQVLRFLDRTEEAWAGNTARSPATLRRDAARALVVLRPRPVPARRGGRRVYVQSSPHHLDRQARVSGILRREQARFLCLVHDLIPIEFPEYARPNGLELHRRRIDTIVRLADGIVANSDATRVSLLPALARAGRTQPVTVAHLGTKQMAPPPDMPPQAVPDRPYFVCIGTIEPRKNHLLLLNLWRSMAARGGAIPRLFIVGRRGWENENIIDMLERCPALTDHVVEIGRVSDAEIALLLKDARAVLLPSFAEGYGMPVAEALSAGVPVLCSDLPALHEAGVGVPEFLDPLDGPAWEAAIRAYAEPDAPRRRAQLDRLRTWRAPTWEDHIAILVDMIHKVAA